MKQIAILGAGMSGFGAAHHFHNEGVKSVIYEKRSHHGGHTSSAKYDGGFIFDEGPHISFTKNERMQELFAESVNQEYETPNASVNNYWQGYWIKHPAQCNLYGLPTDLVTDILKDFIHAEQNEYGEIKNYKDWLIASFGETFAQTYPMQYGLKYHTTPAENMSTDWLGPRLYRPALNEVLRGALSPSTPDVHYVSHFRYPTHNGFVSYLDLFVKQAEIKLDHCLTQIDPSKKELQFSNGAIVPYHHVISSLPLPELIPMILNTPADVLEAAEKLACTTCVNVNIGLNRANISDSHWTYFYDQDFSFSRLSYPHMLSPNTVPPGAGSIQAEVYYSKKYRPLNRTPEELIPVVVEDLKRCQLIREDDEILFQNATLTSYANIIFDLDRADALATVHGYLDDLQIAYCGRYGEWGYQWTDEAFMSGETAAQNVLRSSH